jgi:hypothetical protein
MARKVTYDQEKVKELRMQVILDSLYVFNNGDTKKWSQYRKDLLMKYASRVLPTLNAGKDDDSDIPQVVLVKFIGDDDRDTN